MFGRMYDLLSLAWPLLVFVIFVVLILFAKGLAAQSGRIRFQLAGIIFDKGVPPGMVRIFFAILAVLFLVLPGFRDYSPFFPERLYLTAFFDNSGIDNFLASLSQKDSVRLRIVPDWRAKKRDHIAKMNADLAKEKLPFRFSEIPGQTSSQGEVKFRTRMIDKWGAQLYRIVEANGVIQHKTQLPGSELHTLRTEFHLTETAGSIIDASWTDVYVRHGVLIMPEFKQVVRLSSTQELYYGALTAVTRVDVFPYVNISKTLYLVHSEDGANIPIGYAIYSLPH